MTEDSIFTRKLRKGCLSGELGHPSREPGMSDTDWFNRVTTVKEAQESHVITEITIDTTAQDRNGNRFTGIRGKVIPSGPHKQVLIDKFNNPNTNVCFSVRSFAQDKFVNGKVVKYFLNIVTFDYVLEPGLAQANKWDSPALESFSTVIDESTLKSVLHNKDDVSMEAAGAKIVAEEIMRNYQTESLDTSVRTDMIKRKDLSWTNNW